MQIKQRLRLHYIVSVVTALVILAVLGGALYQVERALANRALAGEISIGAFERVAFRNDYVRTNSERALEQWRAKHQEIGELIRLGFRRFSNPQDVEILKALLKVHQADGKIFQEMVLQRKGPGAGAAQGTISRDTEDRLISQLNIRVYETVQLAVELRRSSNRSLYSAFRFAGSATLLILVLVSTATIIFSRSLSRTVSERVQTLREGAAVIGAGRLDHRIEVYGDDELADLSQAFNSMAAELDRSYERLEQQVEERRRAEEALKQLNEELENRVAERTADLASTIEKLKRETAERVQAAEELREKDRLLVQQSRQAAMGEMIGNIAHQWRQPLNTLGLVIQQLQLFHEMEALTGEVLEQNVATAQDLVRHMSRTIDDFRNYFAPDKEKAPFKVAEAVANTLTLIEAGFRSHNIEIRVTAEGDPVVYGYQNEYAQVLLNILSNARDALTERGTAAPRVSILIREKGGRSLVSVADNAGGIPEEIMGKIFDPYFTTKGPQQGTGLGLFMSKAIIEKNTGGTLSARNLPEGAEFTIEV